MFIEQEVAIVQGLIGRFGRCCCFQKDLLGHLLAQAKLEVEAEVVQERMRKGPS